MKKLLLPLACLISVFAQAQEHHCAKTKQQTGLIQLQHQAREAQLSALTSHELKYDMKFVHLNLNIERDTTYISGNATIVAKVIAPLDTFMTLLHPNHTIDSIRFNGQLLPAVRQDSMVKVKTPATLPVNSSFTATVYYRGLPPTGGSAIGSGFDTGVDPWYGNEATWSLSESFVGYHWWPCKQILTDKIDSSWVFVTTDSTNKAGSNGVLENVVTVGNKKRYEWKSRTPINYYLISVAVAKYKEYNFYAKPQYLVNDSILIQNFVYDNAITNPSWIASDKVDLDKLPQVMNLYSNLFGMYPFYKEKYGHCMAPFGGGEEHQTMTTLLFFDFYLDAHELGHQWWGDNVTCKGWRDIWINEGFATYCEYLTAEYLDPTALAGRLNSDHQYIMGLPGGSVFVNDSMSTTQIFNSRLTYSKGGSIIRSLQFLTNNDSLWFNTLRGFQNTYKNSNASVIDFKNYYQAQTGIDPTQFFSQWYYGEGYPTFGVRYYKSGNTLILKSTQTVSQPSVTPLFITPMEYRISRVGYPDTTLRLMHNNLVETYYIPMTGSVSVIKVDPTNWIINKTQGPIIDPNLDTGIPGLAGSGSEMSIGPNPGSGIFTVHNPSRINGRASVWDLDGKLIIEKKLDGNTQLDLSRYAHGLYEVRVFNEDGGAVLTRKIIKE